jgi:cupin fold WbuC family metalloprotein
MQATVISDDQFQSLIVKAKESPRRRANMNVHKTLESSIQRLFIATEPDTYIRPHRHPEENKAEFFTVLRGHIDLLIFDDQGQLTQRVPMTPTQNFSVEIPPNTWHTYVCMQPGTVALEVKAGPYTPTSPDDFAPWSPPEGHDSAPVYREKLRTLR